MLNDNTVSSSYDVFISYRREGGSQTARSLQISLEQSNLRVFLDVDELKIGKFDEIIIQIIENTPHFIVILSPGALERCKNVDDWVLKEITLALSQKKKIILWESPYSFKGFSFDR